MVLEALALASAQVDPMYITEPPPFAELMCQLSEAEATLNAP
jgi:hypothetical protein